MDVLGHLVRRRVAGEQRLGDDLGRVLEHVLFRLALVEDGAAREVVGRPQVRELLERVLLVRPGQHKGDSTSLQRECAARAHYEKHIHASRPSREMIARPKISRNEWKTAEI